MNSKYVNKGDLLLYKNQIMSEYETAEAIWTRVFGVNDFREGCRLDK